MTRYKKVEQTEVQTALLDLPGWELKEGKLHKMFNFGSFTQAIGWMVSVAFEAEKLDHHPEWSNVYGRVTVNLVTHSLGNAISNLDIELARKMELLAGDGRKP